MDRTGSDVARDTPDSAALQNLPVYDSVNEYEKLHRIGEGSYGVVYKARHIPSGEVVALKKVRFERSRDGVPVTSLRELRVLQACRHPNIVELKKVVTGTRPDSVFLVFEYCEHDLGRAIDAMSKPFTVSEVKCLLKQLLKGITFLHDRWVMHRDLKLSNLLYTRHGLLKLCDFGLARYFQPFETDMTPRVVTLWYRAPELLLGAENYTEAIDMWSVGCIMAELLRNEPLFPAERELECILMMCKMLGSPTTEEWPGLQDLPGARGLQFPDQPFNYLRDEFPAVSSAGIDLLKGLLTYDPSRRISARQALNHAYFKEKPYPKSPTDMPTFPSTHAGGAVLANRVAQERGTAAKRPAAHFGADDMVKRHQQQIDERFGQAFGRSGPGRRWK